MFSIAEEKENVFKIIINTQKIINQKTIILEKREAQNHMKESIEGIVQDLPHQIQENKFHDIGDHIQIKEKAILLTKEKASI